MYSITTACGMMLMTHMPKVNTAPLAKDNDFIDFISLLRAEPFFSDHWGYEDYDFEDEAKKIEDQLRDIKNTQQRLRSKEESLNKRLMDITELNKYQVKEDEYESKDGDQHDKKAGVKKVYRIKITLPGFTKDDLKITIKTNKKHGVLTNSLEITGTKKTRADADGKEEDKGKKITTKVKSSLCFSSYSSTPDKEKSIRYSNGELHLKLDLPRDIDSQEGYKMAFDETKDTLTLEFPKIRLPESSEKQLSFTDEK